MDGNTTRVVFSKEEHILDGIDIVAEFKLEDSYIYTKGEKLFIESINEVKQIDSALEVRRYLRPRLLVIQGILTYFSGCCFAVYQGVSSDSQVIESKEGILKEVSKNKLIIAGEDFSEDLDILLDKLRDKKEKPMVITLLDRWRKSLYMENESEVNTYHDETILTHFHILELLVADYYEQYKKEAAKEIKGFVEDFAYNVMNQRGNNLIQTINSKSKLLNEILINEQTSILTKISFFLKHFNIFDDQTYSLSNKLVKIRNSIAHGRVIYRDKLIWPLPPFFSLVTVDSDYIVKTISVFSARAISLHLGLNAWSKEWAEVHKNLPPSDEVINDFLKDTNIQSKVMPLDLIAGKYNAITVSSLVDFYINNKKCDFVDFENAMSEVVKNIDINQENAHQLFFLSLILADSKDEEVAKISRRNVEIINQYDWHGYLNIKDILRYFEYCNIKVEWFEKWLNEGKHYKHKISSKEFNFNNNKKKKKKILDILWKFIKR